MSGSDDDSPGPGSAPRPGSPAHRFGAPRADAVPRMETVRITAPDLKRRAAMEKTRSRLVLAAISFAVLFTAVVIKLADATILQPLAPHRPERPIAQLFEERRQQESGPRAQRAMITDRNGEILAISLPTAAVYANPREMIDPAEAARKLKLALPRLDEATIHTRLSTEKQFVYLARQITPREQFAINQLGIPGVYFEPTERRRYPMGRTAAQVLGGVDVDGNGVAGVERFFNDRLRDDATPLRLSLDVRVQAVVRDELSKAMQDFRAIGGCGIVMDVRTGEVLAMVSLPDYDANNVGSAEPDERFNRAVTGMYEPGSTFKLQTAAMALDSGVAQLWMIYDASHPLHIGRFTISDFEGKKRPLYFPEVLAYSSNIGAARIGASVGGERQRAWLRSMGMFSRIGIELPEAGLPLVQPAQNWKEIATLTVSFGHGISVSPLHVVRGTAAIANGGVAVRPTMLALPSGATPDGHRVMQQQTSDTMRRIMRLIVTDGFGKTAEVPGYYPGGKTGTAEKVGNRAYKKHANVQAFTSVFPMNAPRFAVYMMLDEAKANASTHGYATAGWVVAPAAGRVIARVGPMLGLLPDIEHKAQIDASLAMVLRPTQIGRAPLVAGGTPSANPAEATPAGGARPLPAPTSRPSVRDLRNEASLAPGPAGIPGPSLPARPIPLAPSAVPIHGASVATR